MAATASLHAPGSELDAAFDGSERWQAYGLAGQSHYVILFYKYAAIAYAAAEAKEQAGRCEALGLSGRLLVATEGLNGTLCGSVASVERYVAWMRSREEFVDTDWKGSATGSDCFSDLHVRVVKEVIATGNAVKAPHEDGAEPEGEELAPEAFHARLSAHLDSSPEGGDWVLLDCRNETESAVGTFKGAHRVPMRTFAQFPKWAADHAEELRGKRVMMFCTGGIRCRKGSAIVNKMAGPAEVVQLRGGIHRYLEAYPDGGLWRGRNFVFDQRQSLAPPALDRPLPPALAPAGAAAAAGADADAKPGADAEAPGAGASASAAPVVDDSCVFGRCHVCARPWEAFSGRDLCQVCRKLLLVCQGCRSEQRGLFWCGDHADMDGVYMRWLEDSTVEELRGQREAMERMHRGIATGRRLRNRRRTLARQRDKIDERLAALDAGEAVVAERAAAHPCPTCAKPACSGSCWGFWQRDVEEQRAAGKLRERDELYVVEAGAAAKRDEVARG